MVLVVVNHLEFSITVTSGQGGGEGGAEHLSHKQLGWEKEEWQRYHNLFVILAPYLPNIFFKAKQSKLENKKKYFYNRILQRLNLLINKSLQEWYF